MCPFRNHGKLSGITIGKVKILKGKYDRHEEIMCYV